ncbi:Bile acid-coenzyme A ligase [compost metagenome]
MVACDSHQWLSRPGTVGRPVPSASIEIVDDTGKPVAAGVIGEIYACRLDTPGFSYINRPDETASSHCGPRVSTGDLGYFDEEGYLYLCDRKRDMVISGGVNIYPAEIESVLQTMAGVHDCAVFGVPSEEFGESLLAVIELQEGVHLSADAVQDYLRQHLASYKVPRRIEFRRDLPREDSGKIFKRRLREPYWQGHQSRI